ncbi:MAG: anti-sigma factor domain-containing protein [Chloroflexota bacterium]
MNDHDEAVLVGAYVLGALAPDELATFEAHLAARKACQDELAELGGVASALDLAAPLAEPPAQIRRNLVREVTAVSPAHRTPRRAFVRAAGALLLAAVVALAFLSWRDVQLQQDVNRHTAALDRQASLLASLTKHARVTHISRTPAASAATAAVVQPKRGTGYLVVQGLPRLKASRVYQACLTKGSRAHVSAGVFRVGTAITVVPLTHPSSEFTTTAVTIEPGPSGSPAPTGAEVLLGNL